MCQCANSIVYWHINTLAHYHIGTLAHWHIKFYGKKYKEMQFLRQVRI